jgi:hypothetical protein
MSGTRGPKPWRQSQLRTTFLRVPAEDWAAVRVGSKTEFRASGAHATQLWEVDPPIPVVAYKVTNAREDHEHVLLVLEATWTEPLAAISEESLRREGFETMAHFRRYWMARTKKRFSPLTSVRVCRVRPLAADDRQELGVRLFDHLYGAFRA